MRVWMKVGPCVVRQVFECRNMKRAISAHEKTLLAIGTLLLRSPMQDFKDRVLLLCYLLL